MKAGSCLTILVLQIVLCSLVLCNRCDDCYEQNSTNNDFLCDGRQCDSFLWPKNISNPFRISCKQGYGANDCYWKGVYSSSPQKYWLYIACNQSIYSCATCPNDTTCTKCYDGYKKYNGNCIRCDDKNCAYCSDYNICSQCNYGYTLVSNYSSGQRRDRCIDCSTHIPGCEQCSSLSQCSVCSLQFIPINGLCYQTDGKTLAGAIDYQQQLSNQTMKITTQNDQMNMLLGQIFVALIFLIAVIFLGILAICWNGRSSRKAMQKMSLLSTHE